MGVFSEYCHNVWYWKLEWWVHQSVEKVNWKCKTRKWRTKKMKVRKMQNWKCGTKPRPENRGRTAGSWLFNLITRQLWNHNVHTCDLRYKFAWLCSSRNSRCLLSVSSTYSRIKTQHHVRMYAGSPYRAATVHGRDNVCAAGTEKRSAAWATPARGWIRQTSQSVTVRRVRATSRWKSWRSRCRYK